MAAGTLIKLKRKAGAFVGGDLAAGEVGVDTTNDQLYASSDGTTVFQIGGDSIASYYAPQDLTSSAAIVWDVDSGATAHLTLAHNTTITLSNLDDGQTATLSAVMGGSGSYTVALAHTGLTVRQMSNPLSDIATLLANDLFEITVIRENNNLRFWVATLEI